MNIGVVGSVVFKYKSRKKNCQDFLTILYTIRVRETRQIPAGCKNLCKRFSTKSRMALESRADSGLNPLITESHGSQNGMRAGTA